MQDCINVKSSRNDKVRHLAWKGRNKKKKEAMCKKLHSELNSLKKFKKSTTHWLNTLNQNPYKDSEKILQVVSNYYMMRNTSKIALKNDAKNQSQQQLTRKKIVTWSCVSRALKSVVLGNLDQSMWWPMPQQLSSPQMVGHQGSRTREINSQTA